MLKPNQLVKVKWGTKNKKRLVELGYEFTHMGDEVWVKLEHLSRGANSKIIYICDYCGAEVATKVQTYNAHKEYCQKDACKKCAHLKSQDAFFVKHGVTSPLQVKEINEKQRQTCNEKYGCEYALQNEEFLEKKNATCVERYGTSSVLLNKEIADKKKATCLEVYGTEYPNQNEEVQAKTRATNLERYGYEYASQNPEIKEKQKNTFLERYDVEYPLQYPEFAQKAAESIMTTLLAHGGVKTSKAQYAVYEMCQEVYGEEFVELNKGVKSFALDVVLSYKDTLIDIEYDGTFWHTDPQKDRRRDEIVKQYGYKVLRIKGLKAPPIKEDLINAIETLANSDRTFMSIKADI